jgi:hypothetical protein
MLHLGSDRYGLVMPDAAAYSSNAFKCTCAFGALWQLMLALRLGRLAAAALESRADEIETEYLQRPPEAPRHKRWIYFWRR